jgi:hypothetical protein
MPIVSAEAEGSFMPEVITKHPDIVLEVLQSAGARCGVGEQQKILTRCPRERFCALPGGEICVYTPRELQTMTQLSRAETCQARADGGPPAGRTAGGIAAEWGLAATLPAVLAAVVLLGRRGSARRPR